MNYKIKTYFILLFLISIYNNVNSQSIDISKYVETIKLDTDRDIYMNGENIYYTVNYFLNNMQKQPTFSNIIYVELINCVDNKPIIQKKIKLSNYKANDVINIPSNIISGNYILRAYTFYQRNFSNYNFSYNLITILNPNNNKYPLIYNTKLDTVEIVSEDGLFLENTSNNIIIRLPQRLLNTNNKYFINESSRNSFEINFTENGFCQKELFLKQDETYTLKIQQENGDTLYSSFPKIKKSGIQTTTSRLNNNIFYEIKAINIKPENNISYYISIFSKDYNNIHKEVIQLNDKKKSLVFPIELFKTGINYIVLFNNENKIININSIYNSNKKIKIFNIETKKDTFSTNENANISFSINNNDKVQILTALVSVSLVGTKKSENLFIPDLYLSNPIVLDNYLQTLNINDKLEQQIIILFNNRINKTNFLKEVSKNITPTIKYIPDIRDVTLRGKLIDKKTKKPISNQDVYLSVLFNTPQLHVYKTTDSGEFIFSLNNVEGLNDIFISTNSNSESEIIIYNPFSANIPKFGILPTFFDTKNKELIKKIYINTQINKYKSKDISKKTNRIKTDVFNINYDKKTIYIKDYIKLKSIEEFFFELIPSVKIKHTNNQYEFIVFDNNGNLLPGKPLLLIDNIPTFDISKIKNIKISKVEKIDIINSKYYLGTHVFYGVIKITTKTDDFAGLQFKNSGIFAEYKGIEQQNSEQYFKNSNITSDIKPDFRTLLYWNPNLKISNKKEGISFRTSYCKGTYNICIKAYNTKGEIFYGNKQIIVK